jgi:hypothetical protein
MNMEQKAFYVAPEAELRAAKIRCSILAGSNQEARPATNPDGGATNTGENIVDDPDDNGARVRTSLGY